MAIRRDEKQLQREERLARERSEQEAARRKRLYSYVAGGILVIASIAAVSVVVASGGGDSKQNADAAFGPHYDGLEGRRQAAGVPTMAEAATVGAAHFHPSIKVYANGEQVQIPTNIGIDPMRPPSDMAGLHTHDSSGTIHNEAGTSAKLGQFFAVWGVPLSRNRLGPHQATSSRRVRLWVDGEPSKQFGDLQLRDGQQIVVAYGKRPSETG
jgi:hypothetical protein